MLKFLALIPRKDDVSREYFAEYYENNHAPLALKYFRGFGKYLRNHIVEEISGEPPEFDVFSEFWYENLDQLIRTAKLLDGEHGPTIRHDEQQFMNQPASTVMPAEEHLVFGAERCIEPAVIKIAAVLKREQSLSLDAFHSNLLAACETLPSEWNAYRLSCFLVQHGSDEELPWDAVVFAWPEDESALPRWPAALAALSAKHMLLKTNSCETNLAEHYSNVPAQAGSTDDMPVQA